MKRIALIALPLLAACHGNNPVPPKTDALIREFVTNYDRAMNAHEFKTVASMYAGGATITIKNTYIHELTGHGPSSPADKAAYDRIAAGHTVTPTEAFAPLAADKNLRYTLSRSAVTIARGTQADHYDVRSKVREDLCGLPHCMITLTDNNMDVVVSDGTVHIQSEYQTVTALPKQTDAAPASSR